jgi:GTP pyrophosphokinase
MSTCAGLIKKAGEYLPAEELVLLEQACAFAGQIYTGKHRLSGLPYMNHAMAVAEILIQLKLDLPTVVAGVLHGALKEPASVPEKEFVKKFGEEIATIVKGATKITSVHFDSRLAFQAENIRRMFLAMSEDIRVLILKLADRLHDMQSLQYVPSEKQQEFARETMDLYAPLASRLGIDWVKRELEDLSFRYLHPEDYRDLAGRISTSLHDRERYVEEVKEILSAKLREQQIKEFRILGRPKHLYSIYKKLQAQDIPLEKVYDKVAFRIILKTVRECYEVLGLLHDLWRPVTGRFKDFISTPKSNMYQSLHTTVVGPYGEFMEVQIRTEEMDRIANDGIAAHWAYKEGKAITTKDARLFQGLKHLVQSIQELQQVQDPGEFLEAVVDELREAEVYALTPKGEVKELPGGSTPLDFAYAIHTEVGDHCAGAKVNGRIVPLKHVLKNGDMVEIITSATQKPNRGWLALVKTSRARGRIRHWLKKEELERALKLGREICERELRKRDLSLKKLARGGHLREILKAFSCNSLDELLRQVGSGKVTVQAMAERMLPEEMRPIEVVPEGGTATELAAEALQKTARPARSRKGAGKGGAIIVDGADDLLVKVSRCCMPVPGDPIAGFITSGRGISVHKSDCQNFLATDPARHIEVSWADQIVTGHQVQVLVVAMDHKGLIAELGSRISGADADIVSMEARTSSENLAIVKLVLGVQSLGHLEKLLVQLRQIPGILEARRK